MILGIDHLALNVSDIDKGIAALENAGYSSAFIEESLLNHSNKKTFLHKYEERHAIALFKSPASIPIELTCHSKDRHAVALQYAYSEGTIFLQAFDVAKECDFWSGFAGMKRSDDPNMLSFVSFLPHWCFNLCIQKTEDDRKSMLDSLGYTCLALLTNAIEKDVALAISNGGHEAVQPFELTVNGQLMLIAMLRSPNNAIIELIELRR